MIWLKQLTFLLTGLVLVIVASAYLFWMPSLQEPPYQLVKTWGGKGQAEGLFNEPTGIAVFKAEVFVSDSRNKRIQVFDLDGNFKRVISVDGELKRPMNLDIANDELFVADFFRDQILVYTLDGKFIRSIGQPGQGNAQFNAPGGVAIDSQGALYVADFFNQRVQKLSSEGSFMRQWGQTGKVGLLDGKLNYPTDVATDANDNLYIADGYNDRIIAYDAQGKRLYQWGGPFAMNIFGPFNGWFATVTGISVGPDSNIYVADFYNDRVQKFTHDGEFLNAWGIKSNNATHTAIAVDVAHDGSVFVADYANHQIQKWRPAK